MASGYRFEGDTLTPAIRAIDLGVDRFLTATVGYHAKRAETYAKTNASWTDRSSNARNGLSGKSETDPMRSYRIILSHAVPYGIWLEVRFAGRYAIIEPTLKHEGVEVMKTISAGLMAGLIAGV